MIERSFIEQKMKEHQIQEYMAKNLSNAGYSHTEIQRTPLGEKIIVYTTRPGLIVGKKGENIKKMTLVLKNKFKLENPQIEIGEVKNPFLDAYFVAGKIASSLDRFGSKRFKSIGYKFLQSIMDAGAVGAEIVMAGKIPSARARSWRFFAGYMKKCGDIAVSQIPHAKVDVSLKSGTIGIKVSIMTPDIRLMERELEKELDKQLHFEETKKEYTPEETQPKQEALVEQQVEEPKKENKAKSKKAKKKESEESAQETPKTEEGAKVA